MNQPSLVLVQPQDGEPQQPACPSFMDFYSQYPCKCARAHALKAWAKLKPDDQRAAVERLPALKEHWNSLDWYHPPHPGTYLNGRRWEDEIPEPKPAAPEPDLLWWQSEAGVLAEGKRRGLNPRPGEEMRDFRQRLFAAGKGKR